MVSGPDSGSKGPGSSSGRVIVFVFLGKTLYYHSASLQPGVKMDIGKLSGKPDKMLGEPLDGLASHPVGVEILLVASA